MKPASLDPQLLLAHGAFVRGVARALLGGDDEVDDVVQDTWLAAGTQAPEQPRRMRAWLAGIARRQAALRIRSRVRERRRIATLAERRAGRAEEADPRQVAASAEAGRRLVAGVLTLPEHYRTAVLLRYHDDLPPRDVAVRLGVPVETVRTRVRRGLALLRERLDASDDRGDWRLALLPLWPGGLAGAPVASGLAIGGGVVSTKLLAAAAALLLLIGGALWLRPWHGLEGEQANDRAALVLESDARASPPPPTLAGSPSARGVPGGAPATAGADAVLDFPTLARRLWWSRADRQALAAWGRRDPQVAARVVDWLHPRHDVDRREPFGGRPLPPSGWSEIQAVFEVLAGIGASTVDLLVAELDAPDASMRERVVHALGYLGPTAAPAVPALLARIEADDGALLPDLFGALGCVGPGARDALPVFTKWLRETWRDDAARAAAAGSILRIAGPTPDVLETCSIALRDGSYEVAVRLLPEITALGERGAPLAGILRELIADETTHDWIRLHAIDTLGCIAPGDERSMAALLHLLGDESAPDETRSAAVQALVRLGPAAQDALFRTAATLEGEERLLVVAAITDQLLTDRVDANRLFELLEPFRKERDEVDRERAVWAARPVVLETGRGIGWIARWMTDASPEVRRQALGCLEDVMDATGAVLAVAQEALEDPAPEVRYAAICLLRCRADGAYGDRELVRSAAWLPSVLRAMKDESDAVRRAAAPLLEELSPEHSARELTTWIALLRSGWPSDVLTAAAVLERVGPDAREAAPALREALARARFDAVKARLREALAAVEAE